jgi:hypothetical protein
LRREKPTVAKPAPGSDRRYQIRIRHIMEYIDIGDWRDDIKNSQQITEKTTVFMESINRA